MNLKNLAEAVQGKPGLEAAREISRLIEQDGLDAPKVGEHVSTALPKVLAYIKHLREYYPYE